MNYFSPKNTAERYAIGRPFFHRNTITKVKDFLKLETKLDKVLDVACGTGLSTKALLDISDNIYGIDTSIEMLKFAEQNEKIKYSISSAETLPFLENEFDLITVCSGVHWFDIDKFLTEANRVLKHKTWLVLYENHFISEMENVSEFTSWFPEMYLKKFPSPARHNDYNWTNENLKPKNLIFVYEDKFKNTIEFTKQTLILYFTTQSNITAAVENGKYSYEEIENWLDEQLTQFFTIEKRKVNFGNWIKYIQKK
jgi:ubiquinone/menaquinone biosynthesis C-methylase UbiE